jgi:hypothetical protein
MGGGNMTITFAIVSIIAVTFLMILAMLIRARNREKTQYRAINFCHEGACWKIVIRLARFWQLLYTRVKIVPGDLLSFRPQIAYSVRKNGREIIKLPNFWAECVGGALCKAAKTDCLAMQIEIVFRDLAMARAFEERLLEMGQDADVKHNKVVFVICLLATENHHCDNQRGHNADNIGKDCP